MAEIRCDKCGALLTKKDLKNNKCWKCKAENIAGIFKIQEEKERKELDDIKKAKSEKRKWEAEKRTRKAEKRKGKAEKKRRWRKEKENPNLYLRFYQGFCYLSLIISTIIYVKTQWAIWKMGFVANYWNEEKHKLKWVLDLYYKSETEFLTLSYWDHLFYPFLVFVSSILFLIALIKIISLFLELDEIL